MRIQIAARYGLLAVLIAGALPAPAEAQLGKFIRKKLKEAVVQTVADTVVGAVMPGGASSGPTAGGTRRARSAAPAGPSFSEDQLEITPDLLDRLERGLTAETAERNAIAESRKKITSPHLYERITGKGLSASGLTERQYFILKERVWPFCAVSVEPRPGDTTADMVRKSGYVYAKGELDALLARCAKLMPLFKD